MEIKVKDLQSAFKSLIGKLESLGINELEIEDLDYYWIVLSPEWVDMSKKPDISVGSLHDDWCSLKKLQTEPEWEASFLDFDRMASILRAISESMNPP